MIPRSEWYYKLILRMPDFVLEEEPQTAVQKILAKNKANLIENVTFIEIDAHLAVQALHIGPFSTEPRTLTKIQDYISKHNLEKAGCHHEIYLSDFRKTTPEKLRIILREPVKHCSE